jgi:hypothetical protein
VSNLDCFDAILLTPFYLFMSKSDLNPLASLQWIRAVLYSYFITSIEPLVTLATALGAVRQRRATYSLTRHSYSRDDSKTGNPINRHCLIIDGRLREVVAQLKEIQLEPRSTLSLVQPIAVYLHVEPLLVDHICLIISVDLRHLLQFITERSLLSINKLMECFHFESNFSDSERKRSFFNQLITTSRLKVAK